MRGDPALSDSAAPRADRTAPSVSVCVTTFRRAHWLERLLEGLSRLEFRHGPEPALEVVVVDNDPDGSAAAVCEAMRPRLRWPLRYQREERQGVSFARNRAIRASDPASEWIAFIDDDEVPEPQWLDELLLQQRLHDADVVAGPVFPRFEEPVPAWMETGGFFAPRRYQTGGPVEHPGSGNVLIRASVLREMPEPFDSRMALSGGEDTLLFLRLARAGRKMVWADEARAHEWIPPSRARAGWILQRAYRVGNTWSICERELRPSPRVAARRIAIGLVRILQGALLLPLAVRGRHVAMRALRYISVGAGNVTGVVGLQYQEYQRRTRR